MGMYFNTHNTYDLLGKLGSRYSDLNNATPTISNRSDKGIYQASATILAAWRDLPRRPVLGYAAHWERWLQYIENYTSDPRNPGVSTVGHDLRAYMYQYLNDLHCTQIEFFAVSSSTVYLHPRTPASASYIGNITIETMTYDVV
jgi:hypothetical protein